MLQRQLLLVSLMILPAMSKTMELGRSGRPTMDDDDVGGAWSAAAAATYGVIDQRWSNCVALHGALDFARATLGARLGTVLSAEDEGASDYFGA